MAGHHRNGLIHFRMVNLFDCLKVFNPKQVNELGLSTLHLQIIPVAILLTESSDVTVALDWHQNVNLKIQYT